MYWALITMATVGYGDITPSPGWGYFVASIAAIMGIAVYTLTISVIADAFLSSTMKNLLGYGRLKGKRILVIGTGNSCKEIIDELIVNGLGDDTGWITSVQPRSQPPVDFIVGEYDEDTFIRAGVSEAEHIVLCIPDDSKTIHTALLIKKLTKKAKISAMVSSPRAGELLKEAGVHEVVSIDTLGRILASTVFEPGVVRFISEITTAHGIADLIQLPPFKEYVGKTVKEVEETLMAKSKPGEKYKIVAILRKDQLIVLPDPDLKIEEKDKIIAIKKHSKKI